MKHANTMIEDDPPPDQMGRSEIISGVALNPVFPREMGKVLFVKISEADTFCADMHQRYTSPLILTRRLRNALHE